MRRIKVHEKALAHLTKGLYRSPASALRELVSNAWDAEATRVEIFTFPPTFNRIVVTDDGHGFAKSDFARLMNEGIGNSTKRNPEHADNAATRRPVLGRLGIGLMGIAQICSRFRVISRPRDGEPFAAEVRILDHLRRRLDEEAAEAVLTDDRRASKTVFIGTWDYVDLGPDDGFRGTRVIVTHPLPSFRRSFVTTLRPVAAGVEEHEAQMSARLDAAATPSEADVDEAMPPLEWESFLREASTKESIAMRGAYWQFLWELATSVPVRYVDKNAVPDRAIATDQKRLCDYKFRVFVDTRELFKPIYLDPKWVHGYTVDRFAEDLGVVSGQHVKLHGYLTVKEAKQLLPSEVRGILIRVKDVAVGGYDPSLLDWQTNQGPRSRWLTGEIFVEDGLEDAMNVDRDSFNQYHPEYLAVQNVVHQHLRKLFKQSYPKIQDRTESRDSQRASARRTLLQEAAVIASGGKPVSLRSRSRGSSTAPRASANRIEVTIPKADDLRVAKNKRSFAASILAIFDIALTAGKTDNERRELFREAFLKALRRWK